MIAQETPQLEGPETPVPSAEPALRQQRDWLSRSLKPYGALPPMLRSCSSGIVFYGARI